MDRATAYYSASGYKNNHCCFLGQLYDKDRGYKPREGECWLIVAKPDGDKTNFDFPYGSGAWLTGLWLSETDTLYVASSEKQVLRNTRVMKERGLGVDSFEKFDVDAPLFGIWGLTDDCIYAWGTRYDNGWEYPLFRWDGQTWNEMPAPGFNIVSLHGIAPDLLYAAGKGAISRWNGHEWQACSIPVPEHFTAVFVAAPNEIYAVGIHNHVLKSNGEAWEIIARWTGAPIPLLAVAKWKGELWIGGGASGLLRRIGETDQLEVVKPNVHAIGFDARHDLVISCSNMIVGTSDGLKYWGTGRELLLDVRKGKSLYQ